MCLPRIGRIQEITGEEFERVARADVAGTDQRVSLVCLPEAAVGDAISIHAGFALSVLPEEEVQGTLAMVELLKRPLSRDGDESGSTVG